MKKQTKERLALVLRDLNDTLLHLNEKLDVATNPFDRDECAALIAAVKTFMGSYGRGGGGGEHHGP